MKEKNKKIIPWVGIIAIAGALALFFFLNFLNSDSEPQSYVEGQIQSITLGRNTQGVEMTIVVTSKNNSVVRVLAHGETLLFKYRKGTTDTPQAVNDFSFNDLKQSDTIRVYPVAGSTVSSEFSAGKIEVYE